MSTFNSNFYTPNMTATREQAEARLVALGYTNFTFKSVSRSNGVSFYFTSEDGKGIRVSDHRLTGNRSFNTIQVDLYEIKVRESVKREEEPRGVTKEMIQRMIAKREAKLTAMNK